MTFIETKLAITNLDLKGEIVKAGMMSRNSSALNHYTSASRRAISSISLFHDCKIVDLI